MPALDFHKKPFDEGTLTKLQIFELYAREWLPVFLAPEKPPRPEIHLFDFFAGPGTDAAGELGSPLRLLRQLKEYQGMAGWPHVRVHAHFFDASPSKVMQLEANIDSRQLRLPKVILDIQPLKFEEAIQCCAVTLANPQAAKLLFVDQCGVDHVTTDVFRQLVTSPTCDFLFFLSSSTLHRFRDHPAIKQKITRPDDYYQVHQAALDYYRGFLPNAADYFLAPFSIKKGSNIYGIIFGSAHPLGMDKFLQVAWKKDEINGEADFDINRDNIAPGEMLLALEEFRPSKITAFEGELEQLLRNGRLKNELDVVHVCFKHGVRRQQAASILAKLKKERVIEADFRVPQINRSRLPRPIQMLP
jgi:three-Cys-motif partner protein